MKKKLKKTLKKKDYQTRKVKKPKREFAEPNMALLLGNLCIHRNCSISPNPTLLPKKNALSYLFISQNKKIDLYIYIHAHIQIIQHIFVATRHKETHTLKGLDRVQFWKMTSYSRFENNSKKYIYFVYKYISILLYITFTEY